MPPTPPILNRPDLYYGVVIVTAAFAAGVDSGRCVILCNNGAITVTLPLAADEPGKAYYIKKIDAAGGAITILPSGADTIDGATSGAGGQTLADQYDVMLVVSDGGTAWHILSSSNL